MTKPDARGCTLDIFKGMSSRSRKRFDKSSNAFSRLLEKDIGSEDHN